MEHHGANQTGMGCATLTVSPYPRAQNWLSFSLVIFLLLLITFYPIWYFPFPGMADYPNHLARMSLLTNVAHPLWHRYYETVDALVPNLAMEAYVIVATKAGIGVATATKSFAAIALLFPVLGTVILAWRISGTVPWITLLAVPLATNRYYLWGFLNYSFSLGLALLLFTVWLGLRRERGKEESESLGTIAHALVLMMYALGVFLLLLSHLAGFGIFLVAVYAYEMGHLFRGSRCAIGNLITLTCSAAPSFLSYAFFFYHGGGGLRIIYYDFLQGKLAGLLSPVYSYRMLPAVLISTIVTAAVLFTKYRLHSSIKMASAMLLPVATVFVAFLVLPSSMMGSGFLDRRLVIFLCFLSLASLSMNYSKVSIALIVLVAVLLVGIKTSDIWSTWKLTDAELTAIRKQFENISPGSRLIQYVVLSDGGSEFPPLRHAASFAVMDRGAFIPSLFAQPFTGETIAYRGPRDAIFSVGKGGVVTGLGKVDMNRVCGFYQYVLVTGNVSRMATPQCLRQIAIGDHFALFSTPQATSY